MQYKYYFHFNSELIYVLIIILFWTITVHLKEVNLSDFDKGLSSSLV
jgi:hypothetical protein